MSNESKLCSCHPLCSCGQTLVSKAGDLCRFCLATDAFDAGLLFRDALEAVLEEADEEEERATACPGCAMGPCFAPLCSDCSDEEAAAEADHQRSHAPGRY